MIGSYILMLLSLHVHVEAMGEDDWVAMKLVICSPLVGVRIEGDWLAIPIEKGR